MNLLRSRNTLRQRRPARTLALAALLNFCRLHRASAGESHADYRYELYQEDHDRIKVETHSVLFDLKMSPRVALKGELVLDTISGATPNGAAPAKKYNYDFFSVYGFQPPIAGNTNNASVPITQLHEFREALSLELPITFGAHTLTPQFSISKESDYDSLGFALNYARELNEKNTTLNLGWSHTSDTVLDEFRRPQDKSSHDFLIGVNQLLGAHTVLTVNFTYGTSHGYLNDPYRFSVAANTLQLDADNPAGFFEQRPRDREKFIGYVGLTHFFKPVNGSLEASYRFFHDTFDVNAHTISLAWYQKLGRQVVVSPSFRYYRQSAAFFYYELLPDGDNRPAYFSPDYRLSQFQSFTYGLSATWNVSKWFTLDAAYKRYVMEGLDGVTSASAYPSATVFTLGCRLWF
ncbi:MAG: hypothetical protein RLZZ350_2396 [Verrucomicrobiota bacterium]|jgi:hypothetical protein